MATSMGALVVVRPISKWAIAPCSTRMNAASFKCEPATSGRVQLAAIRRGRGAPAHRVEEGRQPGRRIDAGHLGQRRAVQGSRAGLDLPDHLKLVASALVFDPAQGHQRRRHRAPSGAHSGRAHLGDHEAPVADIDELTDFGDRAQAHAPVEGRSSTTWRGEQGGRDRAMEGEIDGDGFGVPDTSIA